MPYLGRVLGKVLGTMSKVVLGVSRARVRPRAASGSPPGSEQTSRASHSMQATGLPGNLVPAWVLVVGDVHVGVQGGRARVRRGAWREQWRPRPRPGGRHCRQHDRRDPDRGEGAIVSTRRHHFTSLHFTSLHSLHSLHFTSRVCSVLLHDSSRRGEIAAEAHRPHPHTCERPSNASPRSALPRVVVASPGSCLYSHGTAPRFFWLFSHFRFRFPFHAAPLSNTRPASALQAPASPPGTNTPNR